MMRYVVLAIGMVILATGCKTKEQVTVNADGEDLPFRKVQKNTDLDLKFQYAEKYYKNEDYFKAITLYEELIPQTRLTERGRNCYYRYASCHYEMDDFYLAGYYFKSYHKNNPGDARSEQALFMSALCKVRTSADYSLAQSTTEEALDQLQLFLDRYPETELKDSCNNMMDKLSAKLDLKQFEVAMGYLKRQQYKSAAVMFDVCLKEFPRSNHKEEILFHKLKSNYLYADNSVLSKKMERFEETIKSYHNFVSAFPESDFSKEAENLYRSAMKKTGKAVEQ